MGLGHAEGVGEFGAFGTSQILGLLEGLLQREDLLATERRPRVFLLAVLIAAQEAGIVRHCNSFEGKKCLSQRVR